MRKFKEKTMSVQILRVNRPFLSSSSIVQTNFKHHVPLRTLSKIRFLYQDIHKLPTHSNKLAHSRCGIYTSACIFQNDANSLALDVPYELQSSKSNWCLGSRAKVIGEKEEGYYHHVFADLSAYSGTMYKDNPQFFERYRLSDAEFKSIVDTKNWNDRSPSDVITSFISLGTYASNKKDMTIEDQQFETLISSFKENVAQSTDDQLIDCLIVLKHWPILTSGKDTEIFKIWKELDEVCFKRYLDWTIDKCLFMMDLWYHLGLLKNSFFVYKGLCKISRKAEEFTAAQMIQSLLYMSCKRNINPNIAIREYEYYIQKYITKLSIEEIGIFALAFFKTKTMILNKKILLYLMQRAVEEAETIDTIVIASISKVVRYSHKPDTGFTANDMVKKFIEKRWDSLPLITSIHLVHIGTPVQFFNEEALTKLAEKFCQNPSKARIKDMERISFFLSLYDYIPHSTPNIGQLIVEQLNSPLREKESENFPLVSLSLLYFLSLLRVYPEKQIQQTVNEKLLLERYDTRFRIPEQTVQLDYNRVLEGPPGSEHLLSPQLREYLARRYSMFIPSETHPIKSHFDTLMFQVMEMTDKLLGKENNFVTYTLPHFPRADILFRLDESGNPLPIPEEMRSSSQFEDVHRPIGHGKWYSVVIGGRNMYMHNVPRLVGEQTAKIRQLKSLGYTPIVIPSYYWKKEEDKMEYLKLKYFTDYKKGLVI